MSMSGGLDSPYYSGGAATSAAVPGRAHMAINGHAFMLDLQRYKDAFLEVMRQQADQSAEPGGGSLNPNDLWRRDQASWHLGSGQEFLDGQESIRERYHESLGVDPWTEGKVSLLPATASIRSSTVDEFTSGLRVGSLVYFASGSVVQWSDDASTFRTVTGIPGPVVTWTTDGRNVYMGFGPGIPIYVTGAGSLTAAVWDSTTFSASLLGYVKNRLMAADGRNIYNLKTGASRTDLTPLFIPAEWTWTAFGEAPGYILLGGFLGDDSTIWRTTIQPEGTDLTAPVLSGRLPDGEQLMSLGYYQNLTFIGTTLGLRAAQELGSGLSLFPLIEASFPVECFDPQGDFMWYGVTDFDPPNGLARRSGVGRLSLRNFTIAFRPAFASDLMAPDGGSGFPRGRVTSILTFNGKRLFTIRKKAGAAANGGMFLEQTSKEASGTLVTGGAGYDIPEAKSFRYLVYRHKPLPGGATVTATISVDEDDFTSAGTSSSEGTTEPSANGTSLERLVGYRANLKFVLARGTDTSTGPTLTQWTLRAWPIPRRTEAYVFPLIVRGQNVDLGGNEGLFVDPSEELEFLKDIIRVGLPVTCQLGPETFEMYPIDMDFSDVQSSADGAEYRGTVIFVGRRFD